MSSVCPPRKLTLLLATMLSIALARAGERGSFPGTPRMGSGESRSADAGVAAGADEGTSAGTRAAAVRTSTRTGKKLPAVTVTGRRETSTLEAFPATSASVGREQVQTTVNAVDVEDAVKYLPSLFIRKRNYGDTQPVLATRDWGVNSSARTLVYVDDIPISALIANNNTLGAPRWGMVSPEQIERIDMLYGPYSAEYAGNSMGGVLRIVTRSPQKTEFSLDETAALQSFDLYETDDHYATSQTSVTAGGRTGGLSWFLSGTFQSSFSQPLALVTAGAPPAGAAGAIPADNKLGRPADMLGAAGLLHTRETNLLARLSDDLTPVWRATWLIGLWRNDADSGVRTYLTDASGRPTYAGIAGFASNTYRLLEDHLMTGLSVKSDSHGAWDAEAVATYYDYLEDRQRSPAGVAAVTDFTAGGRLADYGGTGWATLDLKGIWRPFGYGGAQEITFGAHADRYVLDNPTWSSSLWPDPDTRGALYSSSRGRTETEALWMQDTWTPGPAWRLTVGARAEHWRASEGFNFGGDTAVVQPPESAGAFSPKATLRWRPSPEWTVTGSVGRAVRFPTVGELYQLVSTGSTYASPNPDLAPERDWSGELAIERALSGGRLRVSLFQENTRDALISQSDTLDGYPVPVTYVVNVGEVRNRGIELAGQRADLLIDGLELSGSVTFVDSTTLSDAGFASTSGTTAQGKHVPYVPRWRATLVATYRPTPRWAFTLAGRYSGRMYSTLDNTDDTPHVFGAFDSFIVVDARVHWQATEHLSASLGVDNLNDRVYFLYHPFPQRTVVADLHLKL